MKGRLTIVDINGASQQLVGRLQRFMNEIRPGTFIGLLPTPTAREIWARIKAEGCVALMVVPARNEAGFVVATHGKDRREPVDNYGIQIISYKSFSVGASMQDDISKHNH